MEILQVLQSPNVFTIDRDTTRVHVVLVNEITPQRYTSYVDYCTCDGPFLLGWTSGLTSMARFLLSCQPVDIVE